jgi:hypothetical protein
MDDGVRDRLGDGQENPRDVDQARVEERLELSAGAGAAPGVGGEREG